MATKALSRDDLAFGRAVLLATDSLGMAAEGAFWLFDGSDGKWQYFLVSSLFDRVGPRELYLRLNEALAKTLSEHEIEEFTFYIASPNEELVKDIRKITTTAHATEPRQASVTIGGRRTDACVYRLATTLDEARARRAQRSFRRRTRQIQAEAEA